MPSFIRAYAVHVLTASGTAFALVALILATRGEWVAMFLVLGAALVIDGIDGPLARRFEVKAAAPRWSGDILDLVVDFLNYVFVPAYAMVMSGLLPELLAIPLGIVVVMTGALYFSDTDMKMVGNYFRGFPTLWNAVAFYVFVLKPSSWLAAALIIALAVLTFVPFRFVHPIRVVRLRTVTIAALVLWAVLAAIAVAQGLAPSAWVAWGLALLGVYFLGIGLTDRQTAKAT